MNKRNKNRATRKSFFHNDNIVVFYTWQDSRGEIVPGDKILFKNTRGKFTFLKAVENRDKNVTWIDCIEDKTHNYRSFYAEKLKGKVRPRKTRKKFV